MCGIVGYIGPDDGVKIVLEGLRRLEYRGYDSAGVATIVDGDIKIRRSEGKLSKLNQLINNDPISGSPAIGHTRWATHGVPSMENAHPHRVGSVVLVHNGIVENFVQIKTFLKEQGRVFSSQTDTELISHLIDIYHEEMGLLDATAKALDMVKGSYALAILSIKEPDRIVVARKESPLVVGIGDGEMFIASDIPAILGFTNRIAVMDDFEVGVVTTEGYRAFRIPELVEVKKEILTINMAPALAQKQGYKHFMLKEIFEQPQAITDTLRGRIDIEHGDVFLDDEGPSVQDLARIQGVHLSACGTSLHAAMIGQHLIAKIAKVPVYIHAASDFDPELLFGGGKDLFVAITQSGETIDTLKALRFAKQKGMDTLAICNVVASSIAREARKVLYTRAGPEISVASTKAFTSQITALFLLAVGIGRAKNTLTTLDAARLLEAMARVPGILTKVLKSSDYIRELAHKYLKYEDFLYLGRNLMYPVALEGALKLKEISYIHAEGYSAGEMKHGPIALIDESFPTVMLAPQGPWYRRTISNLQEVKARDGRVIALVTEGDELAKQVDDAILLPPIEPFFAPIISVVPLQLFAYHVADIKGTDVDQPRNLAKSVTVE